MIAGLLCVVSSALINVLNRKMQSVHFSIIQFDYAFFAWITMFVLIIAEYAFFHDDKQRYNFPTIRILTYNFNQLLFIVAYALANFFV